MAPASSVTAARVIREGSAEAFGVLALLNDPATGVVELDVDAALDRRAALNLIRHRDGADAAPGTADDDRFGSIAEVDGVSFVGDAALRALLAYARAEGWVPTVQTFYGSVEGAMFLRDEAAAVVNLANIATFTELDVDVALDARAAQGIVDRRPFTRLEEVAAAPFVGRAALERLRAEVVSRPLGVVGTIDAVAGLSAVAPGLLYLSESDRPVEVVQIAGAGPIDANNAHALLQAVYVPRPGEPGLLDREVEVLTVGDALDRFTVLQPWWDPYYFDMAPQWHALQALLEDQLLDTVTVRLGTRYPGSPYLSGAIDVYVLGVSADGDLVGVWTVSVET
jgi:hypothetical protein